MSMPNAITIENVSVKLDGTSILEAVTAKIPKQGVTAIIGPNGAGKTTLLHSILGLIPYSGKIRFDEGRAGGKPRLGYVPQRLDFDRGSPITALDFLAMSHQRLPLWFGATGKSREMALVNLARVRSEHLIHRPIGKLSGGEFQRVQLALALQSNPDVVLLDEPVSGVDIVGERLFCDLLEQVRDECKLTMVIVSHDLTVVSRHATHVICLNRKTQCEGPTPSILTPENIARVFGPHMGIYEHHGDEAHHCSHDHHHHHGPDVGGAA